MWHHLKLALSDINLAHSVFALPFAVLGACLASPAFASRSAGAGGAGGPPRREWGAFAGQLALVIACMVFARTWAMLVNRLADRRFDAANPRTARRVFASGLVAAHTGWAFAALSALGFIACCGVFWAAFDNPWPLALSVPTLAAVAFYSFTKRFTWASHVFLGGALAASPIAAALAVRPEALADTPAIWTLAGNTLLWVAGFDVLYAMQDIDFDRGAGLRSVPAAFGARRSAWISRALHVGAVACLVATAALEPRLGWLFATAALAAAGLLVFEHAYLAQKGLSGLPVAFGLVNGVFSVMLGAVGVADLVLA